MTCCNVLLSHTHGLYLISRMQEHVVLNQPWHMLHPCCTAGLMTAILDLQPQQQRSPDSQQQHAWQQHILDAEQLQQTQSTASHNHKVQCQDVLCTDTTKLMVPSPLNIPARATHEHPLCDDQALPDIDDLMCQQLEHGRTGESIFACTHTPPTGAQQAQQSEHAAASSTAPQPVSGDTELPEGAGNQALLQYMKAWWGLVGRVLA